MGERKDVYRILVWKTEGGRPLGRPTRRRKEDVTSGSEMWGMERIELAEDRDRWQAPMNAVIKQ
jgi:hypothetical protein